MSEVDQTVRHADVHSQHNPGVVAACVRVRLSLLRNRRHLFKPLRRPRRGEKGSRKVAAQRLSQLFTPLLPEALNNHLQLFAADLDRLVH